MALAGRPRGCGPDPPTGLDRAQGSPHLSFSVLAVFSKPSLDFRSQCLD